MNPLIPSSWDFLLSIAILIALLLSVVALVSLWLKGAPGRHATWKWTLIIILFPVVGALAWFLGDGAARSGGATKRRQHARS